MNPRLVLSLWRERWGKTADTAVKLPYLEGKPTTWGHRLTHTYGWSVPALASSATLACIALWIWMLLIGFSTGGQLAFSGVLLGFALYLRRYKGTLVTLTLLGVSLLVSTRYLYWRFTVTLAPEFNSDFVFGLGLFGAELHLWILTALGFLHATWPLKHTPTPLPQDQGTWPTVDIYLRAHSRDYQTVLRQCSDALALQWPRQKLHLYLLDGEARENVRHLAGSIGATYLCSSSEKSDPVDHVYRAIQQTQGELVAVLDGDHAPTTNFLHTVVGWFVRDPSLGMLRTAQRFLGTDAGPGHSRWLVSTAPQGSCTLVRRSLVIATGVLGPVTANTHTDIARSLNAQGYRSGCIGFDADPTSTAALFYVDQGLSRSAQRVQQRLAGLRSMLQFYLPVPRWVFFTAPLAYLLADVHLIQTSPAVLVAYAMPHFVHGYIAQGRLVRSKRTALWPDLRDAVLGWYLLLPTAMGVVRTEIRQLFGARSAHMGWPKEGFHWTRNLPFCTLLTANLVGLVVGLVGLAWHQGSWSTDASLYLFWCVCNVLVLTATLAVAEETRHIRRHTRKLSRLPAMIQLPTGHTVACETLNFPDTTLSLTLPTPMALVNGSDLNVSVFFDPREYEFPARVLGLEHRVLKVQIADSGLQRYRGAQAAILSRGSDWPQWLPGRNADNPLPVWLSRPAGLVLQKAKALWEQLSSTMKQSWLGLWTKKRKIQT